jgi:hypothetical protein
MVKKKQRQKASFAGAFPTMFRSVVIVAVINMAATAATFWFVLLCLVVARQFA